MNRLQSVSMNLALLLASIAPTWAQEPVWRCGATITNRLPEDLLERQACIEVSLPLATTVHVSPVGAVAPLKGTVQSVSAPERTEQKQRDAQARQLLLGEVERVQAQWRNAQAQGDSQASAKAQADLASLQRELARLP